MVSERPFNSLLYPKTYSAQPLYKILYTALYLLLLLVPIYTFQHYHSAFKEPVVLISLIGFFVAIVYGVTQATNKIFAKTILYTDRIVSITWFSKQEMHRDDIAGIKLVYRYRGQLSPELINKNPEGKSFSMPEGIHKDDAWDAWMAGIPDLDAKKPS